MLRILPADNYAAMGRFIQVPWTIYAKDPNWVPPLKLERRLHLSRHNPFFEHARWRAWVAYRGEHPVGRISAQIDQLRLDRYQTPTGCFGMVEGENDPELFSALFKAAESWLREEGMRKVLGPFNLSINDECGLLVDGFDTEPSIMMGHAPPYYAEHVKFCGYEKAKDIVTYRMHPNYTVAPVLEKIVDRSSRALKDRLKVRPLNRRHLNQEIDVLREIFNDAWQDNWGFVPFTQAEFRDVGAMLKAFVDDDYIQIGEIDGEPVSFIVCLPNVNELIRDLNGRLFPFGWMKLLWRIKRSPPNAVRVALMGIRKNYQHGLMGSGISLSLIHRIKKAALARGANDVEMGWILEDNKPMRNIIEGIGGKLAKRYRLYEKAL